MYGNISGEVAGEKGDKKKGRKRMKKQQDQFSYTWGATKKKQSRVEGNSCCHLLREKKTSE